MSLEVYLAYLAAVLVILIMPGPTTMLVTGYALDSGRNRALRAVPGVVLGDFTAMTFSFLGLGAFLSLSAVAFTLFKICGALYLIYLGVKMWRSGDAVLTDVDQGERSGWRIFGHAYFVTALNPKSIAFFCAFMPQFINPAQDVRPQILLMGATFLILAGVNVCCYACLAGGVRSTLLRPGFRRGMRRVSGGLLIGAGLLTAAARRTS